MSTMCKFAFRHRDVVDTLDILKLLHKKPQPYDPCCKGDEKTGRVDLCIRLCLTVIAYNAESPRALQLLVWLLDAFISTSRIFVFYFFTASLVFLRFF